MYHRNNNSYKPPVSWVRDAVGGNGCRMPRICIRSYWLLPPSSQHHTHTQGVTTTWSHNITFYFLENSFKFGSKIIMICHHIYTKERLTVTKMANFQCYWFCTPKNICIVKIPLQLWRFAAHHVSIHQTVQIPPLTNGDLHICWICTC